MAAQRLWVAGLSWLLVGCKGSDGISPPLPPCTSGTPLALAVGVPQSVDPAPVSGCIVFPASPSATEYLLVPQAATGTPNDMQTFKLVGSALAPSAMASLVAAPGPAPAPGLTQVDLDALRAVFDTRLYEIDTTAFGRESDIDHNGVVIVLMTNRVNELVTATACSNGFVAGYFYGADIDPYWGPQYNNGEVFYALVADPLPVLKSCAHTVADVTRLVPVTFIHEFQHMIKIGRAHV